MLKISSLLSISLSLLHHTTLATYDIREYTNPILPGWNSGPSCIFVTALDNTFFCSTSSFLTFPGLPIYASKDLTNWKLASYVFNRPEQRPDFAQQAYQQGGMFAATLRYHDGHFLLAVTELGTKGLTFLLFNTTDPYSTWSDPLFAQQQTAIDPDLFFDDGTLYTVESDTANVKVSQAILNTNNQTISLSSGGWNGIGGHSLKDLTCTRRMVHTTCAYDPRYAQWCLRYRQWRRS